MKKSNLVLLDANIVIDACREGYWNSLINGHKIHLPATVVRDEIQYFDTGKGKKLIHLSPLIEKGNIIVLEATLEDEKKLQSAINSIFLSSFDPGEREALALLHNPRYKDFLFCTGDRAAVKGLGILGLSQQAVSTENLLKEIGISKKLKIHFTENWLQRQLAEGRLESHLWKLK